MLYHEYLKTINKGHLQDQMDLIDEEILKCEHHEYHYRLKKLIVLRRKIKKKIDNYWSIPNDKGMGLWN